MGEIADYKISDVSFEQLTFFKRGNEIYAVARRGNYPHSGVEVRWTFGWSSLLTKNDDIIDDGQLVVNAGFPDLDQFPHEGARLTVGKTIAEIEGQFDGDTYTIQVQMSYDEIKHNGEWVKKPFDAQSTQEWIR